MVTALYASVPGRPSSCPVRRHYGHVEIGIRVAGGDVTEFIRGHNGPSKWPRILTEVKYLDPDPDHATVGSALVPGEGRNVANFV